LEQVQEVAVWENVLKQTSHNKWEQGVIRFQKYCWLFYVLNYGLQPFQSYRRYSGMQKLACLQVPISI
jgi:hypothetical protein